MQPTVALIKTEDVKAGLAEAWRLLGTSFAGLSKGDTVLIKPNCTCARAPETGAGSDMRIACVLAALALSEGASEVIVAEGMGSGDNSLEEVTGIDELRAMGGVRVIDLNDEATREVPVPNPLVVDRFEVPQVVLESDFLVNLAKLKVHPQAGFSLAFKNMMGALPGRSYRDPKEARRQGYLTPIIPGGGKKVFHDLARDRGSEGMQSAFVDLNTVIRSKLTVIDGLYGMEGPGSPARGKPVKMDLLIVSRDIVAAEAVGAAVMGFDPAKISYLSMAVERGLGDAYRLEEITVRGERIDEVRRKFEPASAAAVWV